MYSILAKKLWKKTFRKICHMAHLNVSFIKTQKTVFFNILVNATSHHNTKQINSPWMKGRLRHTVSYGDRGSICLTVSGDLIDLIAECKTRISQPGMKEISWVEVINHFEL